MKTSQVKLSLTLHLYHVEQFVEKPHLLAAQHYMASNAYYWNAGIFLWQVSTILKEIANTTLSF